MRFSFSDLILNLTKRMVRNQQLKLTVRKFCRSYSQHNFLVDGKTVLSLQLVDTARHFFIMLTEHYPAVFRYDRSKDILTVESFSALEAVYDTELTNPTVVSPKPPVTETVTESKGEVLEITVKRCLKQINLLTEQMRSLNERIAKLESKE